MRLLLIDGHYYAYRSFYAIQHLHNSRGEPTNMLYGMTKTLQRMLSDVQPDYAAVIMDGGLPAERMAAQPDYKANRAETPAPMAQQMPWIDRLVPALGFPLLCLEGEEADDLIASYTRAVAAETELSVIIATNDKDIMQLVGSRVTIYQPGPEGFNLLDAAGVEEKWGVPPEKIGEILILTGDSVDNIPGVPGIGPKTAAQLVRQFGTVAAMLNRMGEIKSEKQRAAIEQARELLARNQVMVRLRESLPLPTPWRDLLVRPDWPAQAALFAELEFKTLQRQAEAHLTTQPKPLQQVELF
jgi:DNA polymerase I